MASSLLTIEPLGDACLVVRFGTGIDAVTSRVVAAATAALTAAALPGVVDIAATFNTVAVVFDPHRADPRALSGAILARLRSLEGTAPAAGATGAIIEIPVAYGGDDGPDLAAVAAHIGLDSEAVVRLHTSTDHVVGMIGFAPGFPYLLGLPAALSIPRRATPRTSVPAGSVAIAERQTGIYPRTSPGGWHVIGRTPRAMFDPRRDPPALLRAGDRVRFVPVTGALRAGERIR
ncbi:MAG: 5-oxoprolinase subunit PxpB [Planctomycetota bacterium]|nr:5-oxoprolinase subunit PxpB [Planctomycetota bacterium]